jgi:hypothetical protein
MSNNMSDTRDYVIQQAKENIELVKKDKSFVSQAKQINTSLANIVAMERNAIMLKALNRGSNPNRNING